MYVTMLCVVNNIVPLRTVCSEFSVCSLCIRLSVTVCVLMSVYS